MAVSPDYILQNASKVTGRGKVSVRSCKPSCPFKGQARLFSLWLDLYKQQTRGSKVEVFRIENKLEATQP